MGRVPDIKRIQVENFDKDDQAVAEKLAYPLNSFMEQTQAVLKGNVDFQNLNRELLTLDVLVGADGKPVVITKVKSALRTKVAGLNCIRANNSTDSTLFVVGAPFVTFTQTNDILTILHVTGLQANNKYRLILESIGT